MSATLDMRPDTTVAAITFTHVEVLGALSNDPATGDEKRYKLVASSDDGDHDDLVSYIFNVNADGEHTWDDLMFPVAGAWTVDLIDLDDDGVEATMSVTVE